MSINSTLHLCLFLSSCLEISTNTSTAIYLSAYIWYPFLRAPTGMAKTEVSIYSCPYIPALHTPILSFCCFLFSRIIALSHPIWVGFVLLHLPPHLPNTHNLLVIWFVSILSMWVNHLMELHLIPFTPLDFIFSPLLDILNLLYTHSLCTFTIHSFHTTGIYQVTHFSHLDPWTLSYILHPCLPSYLSSCIQVIQRLTFFAHLFLLVSPSMLPCLHWIKPRGLNVCIYLLHFFPFSLFFYFLFWGHSLCTCISNQPLHFYSRQTPSPYFLLTYTFNFFTHYQTHILTFLYHQFFALRTVSSSNIIVFSNRLLIFKQIVPSKCCSTFQKTVSFRKHTEYKMNCTVSYFPVNFFL